MILRDKKGYLIKYQYMVFVKSRKLEIDDNFLNMIKCIYRKPTPITALNSVTYKHCLQKFTKARLPTITTYNIAMFSKMKRK